MPRWSNLSKGSANEWKNQIYLDFSRMQPTFTAQSDVKVVQNRERKPTFDAFSVVCSDFVRLFVEILFGRLWHFVRLFAPQHHSQND